MLWFQGIIFSYSSRKLKLSEQWSLITVEKIRASHTRLLMSEETFRVGRTSSSWETQVLAAATEVALLCGQMLRQAKHASWWCRDGSMKRSRIFQFVPWKYVDIKRINHKTFKSKTAMEISHDFPISFDIVPIQTSIFCEGISSSPSLVWGSDFHGVCVVQQCHEMWLGNIEKPSFNRGLYTAGKMVDCFLPCLIASTCVYPKNTRQPCANGQLKEDSSWFAYRPRGRGGSVTYTRSNISIICKFCCSVSKLDSVCLHGRAKETFSEVVQNTCSYVVFQCFPAIRWFVFNKGYHVCRVDVFLLCCQVQTPKEV